jgi:hypothetical protein
MYKIILTIIRCWCGEELVSLEYPPDRRPDQRTIKKRCEACGEVTVLRKDEVRRKPLLRSPWASRRVAG